MALIDTYLGAVKPVGEKILLVYNTNRTTTTTDSNVEYDFVINQDYYVTGLSVTKIGTALPTPVAAVALAATVVRIDNTATASSIAQAGFKSISGTADGLVGQKSIAGSCGAAAPVQVGAIAVPLATGTMSTFNGALPVPSTTSNVAGTTNAQNLIRVRVAWAGSALAGGALDPSCVVEVRLAKYNDLITQGTNASTKGVQLSEVSIPPI